MIHSLFGEPFRLFFFFGDAKTLFIDAPHTACSKDLLVPHGNTVGEKVHFPQAEKKKVRRLP